MTRFKAVYTNLALSGRNIYSASICFKGQFSTAVNKDEYCESPEYPPILDISKEAQKQREVQSWYDKIKRLPTVEEKLFEINIPKYYGWKTLKLTEGVIPYNTLAFSQFITKTHFIEKLPSYYSSSVLEDEATEWLEKLKIQIEEAIVFEHKYRRRKHEYRDEEDGQLSAEEVDKILTKSIVKRVNQIILANTSLEVPHLLSAQVDHEPRVEAFWFVGGIEPDMLMKKVRKGSKYLKHKVDEPIERPMQYYGSTITHLRSELPLPEILDLKEADNPNLTIPDHSYDPRVHGLKFSYTHGTNIPGFWPGDPCEFGILSYHPRSHMLSRPQRYGEDEHREALHSQAILASYGWLLPQACYQGFSTFNNVTYPLVTQTVITNGQLWSFYVYQLNATEMHNYALDNPRQNICWGTETMKLFESIEDGKLVGFNDEVLKTLLKFYLNVPTVRSGVEMRPYLGNERYVANYDWEEKRNWLEKSFKHMYSNRPRARLQPEVYLWEKFYKIDNKTRPMDARRRPFELGIDPFKRRYDEHVREYIPKAHRKYKWQKWARTFYPR